MVKGYSPFWKLRIDSKVRSLNSYINLGWVGWLGREISYSYRTYGPSW